MMVFIFERNLATNFRDVHDNVDIWGKFDNNVHIWGKFDDNVHIWGAKHIMKRWCCRNSFKARWSLGTVHSGNKLQAFQLCFVLWVDNVKKEMSKRALQLCLLMLMLMLMSNMISKFRSLRCTERDNPSEIQICLHPVIFGWRSLTMSIGTTKSDFFAWCCLRIWQKSMYQFKSGRGGSWGLTALASIPAAAAG